MTAVALQPQAPTDVPQERVSNYLRTILQNKVNGTALTCFQAFVHWFLTTFSCFHPAYNRLYDQLSRIKYFPDMTQLRDLTAQKIAAVEPNPQHVGRPVPAGGWPILGYLTLNGLEILASQAFPGDPVYFTDRVTVEDSPDTPGQTIITEYEPNGTPRRTNIDVEHPFLVNNLTSGRTQTMLVTEQAILRQPHRFIHGQPVRMF